MGRRARARIISKGGPLIRVKPADLVAAGVERVPRVTGVRDGKPLLSPTAACSTSRTSSGAPGSIRGCRGSTCRSFGYGADGEPVHERGIVPGEPGLYFVGLHFLYSFSSTMIHGVARDAERIADTIQARMGAEATMRQVEAVTSAA